MRSVVVKACVCAVAVAVDGASAVVPLLDVVDAVVVEEGCAEWPLTLPEEEVAPCSSIEGTTFGGSSEEDGLGCTGVGSAASEMALPK